MNDVCPDVVYYDPWECNISTKIESIMYIASIPLAIFTFGLFAILFLDICLWPKDALRMIKMYKYLKNLDLNEISFSSGSEIYRILTPKFRVCLWVKKSKNKSLEKIIARRKWSIHPANIWTTSMNCIIPIGPGIITTITKHLIEKEMKKIVYHAAINSKSVSYYGFINDITDYLKSEMKSNIPFDIDKNTIKHIIFRRFQSVI